MRNRQRTAQSLIMDPCRCDQRTTAAPLPHQGAACCMLLSPRDAGSRHNGDAQSTAALLQGCLDRVVVLLHLQSFWKQCHHSAAGVPGMVAGMLRHLHSLRRMERDHGWIHTMLEEAENERM